MKKIFATFLLLIFTSNFVVFADTTNSKPVFTPVDIQKEKEKQDEINITKLDKENPDIVKYHNKFLKYSSQKHNNFYKTDINKVLKGYKHYNYPEIDNSTDCIRIELQDGDYAILDNNIQGVRIEYDIKREYQGGMW